MELTKEQIKHIDNRLEQEGIIYWDIRIEMLDHVVSDVEKHLKPFHTKNDFHQMVQESFIALGWKENFNGGGFKKVFSSRLRLYNKDKNKKYWQYFKEFLLKPSFILSALLYAISVFCFQDDKLVSKVILFSPMLVYAAYMIRFILKFKVFNTARIGSAIFFATFPMTILNVVVYIPKVFFEYETSIFSLSLAMIVVAPISAVGISYLNEEFKKAQKIYDQLIS